MQLIRWIIEQLGEMLQSTLERANDAKDIEPMRKLGLILDFAKDSNASIDEKLSET